MQKIGLYGLMPIGIRIFHLRLRRLETIVNPRKNCRKFRRNVNQYKRFKKRKRNRRMFSKRNRPKKQNKLGPKIKKGSLCYNTSSLGNIDQPFLKQLYSSFLPYA